MIRALAAKDLRLLLRDRRAVVILIAMPLIFILVLGVSLGEGFGKKPVDALRVSVVDLDQGNRRVSARQAAAAVLPLWSSLAVIHTEEAMRPPDQPWSQVVLQDLGQTANIQVEVIDDLATAQQMVNEGRRAAVLVFQPGFSERITQCSFLADGINPFYRDGVNLAEVEMLVLRDPTQLAASSIIEQVAQVTLLRVVLPWMIGRAFEKLSEPTFIDMMGREVRLPSLVPGQTVPLSSFLLTNEYKKAVGLGVQKSISRQFPKYDLTAKTWAALTKSKPDEEDGVGVVGFVDDGGSGALKFGAARYQILVPSYTVMFAFFLVLTVGWLFVAERRQGTLKRLLVAPLTRTQILLGKLVPCLTLSLAQGFFLLLAGRLVFGMSWGSEPLWLIPVVVTTSLAAMGMAMLVACLARTETQVAIYGTLLVLVMAGISGCLMPRELMPEQMKQLSRITPHAWSLDAYNQLLLNPTPSLAVVGLACAVLATFGVGFVLLAWLALKLE